MTNLVENRWLHVGIVLLMTMLCYFPGLNSLFLFDDGPNLEALSQIQDSTITGTGFWEFVFSGNAGPTGRPVSLFTFALQAASWPDNPLAFKLANLIIHGLSSVLVYFFSFRLAMHLQAQHSRSCLIALAVALVWALHPVHTSTVLYAVQRMALLSNFFMLAGLYGFLCFRLEYAAPKSKHLVLLTLVLGCSGLLALLSKENAPSMVFYLLALEYTLLKNLPASTVYRYWRSVCLWLPAIVLILLPLVFLGYLQSGFEESRTFTMGERLLTQTRILWTYLGAIIMPSTASVGIFHDTAISTSLINPVTTVIALGAWIALAALCLARPGKYSIGLFALSWFWAGHLVESTIVPLELFFHHRNYLAFYGIAFALLFGFFNWLPDTLLKTRGRLFVVGIYLLLLAVNTFRISGLWSEPVRLAETWYTADPSTDRNVEFYAMQLTQYGREGELLSAAVLTQAVEDNPGNFHVLLNLTTLACVNPLVLPPEEMYILNQARTLSVESRDPVSPIRQIIGLKLQGRCNMYSMAFLESLLDTLIEQTEGHDKGMYQFEKARLMLSRGDTLDALPVMSVAWENSQDTGILFNLAIQQVNVARFSEALATIDLATREVIANNNIRTGTRASKLASLNSMREDVIGFMADE